MDGNSVRKKLDDAAEHCKLPGSVGMSNPRHPVWKILRLIVHGSLALSVLFMLLVRLSEEQINNVGEWLFGLDFAEVAALAGLVFGIGGFEGFMKLVTRKNNDSA